MSYFHKFTFSLQCSVKIGTYRIEESNFWKQMFIEISACSTTDPLSGYFRLCFCYLCCHFHFPVPNFSPFHLRSLVQPLWKGCETQLTGLRNDIRECRAREGWRPGQRDLLKGLLSACFHTAHGILDWNSQWMSPQSSVFRVML